MITELKYFVSIIFIGLILTDISLSQKHELDSDTHKLVRFNHTDNSTVLDTTGLVAHYPFNGNANDESGNGYHGTVSGASLSTDRFGSVDQAYQFNGLGSKIATNFLGILGDHTRSTSLWIKTNPSTWLHMSGLGYGGIGCCIQGQAFECYLYYDGNLHVGIDIQDAALMYAPFIDDNNWHHYVWIVPNASTVRLKDIHLYQDGRLLTTVTGWWNSREYSENAIVNTLVGNLLTLGEKSDGEIDDIRIYNRSLSEIEIQELYHENSYMSPSISGNIFHDLNSDSLKNVNEWRLQQWKVRITGAKVDSTITDVNGFYEFNSLPLGSYTLSVDILPDWVQTYPAAPYTYSIAIADSGGSYTSCDFGVRRSDGLVAYYPFNSNANDESGNGNNGTVNGATSTADRFGNAIKSYSLDGVSDFIEVPDSPSLDVTTEATFSAWIYPRSWVHSTTVYEKANTDSDPSYMLYVGENAEISGKTFRPHIYTTGWRYGAIDFQATDNQWYHVVFTYKSSTGQMKAYVNGVEHAIVFTVEPIAGETIRAGTAPLFIAKSTRPGANWFNGIIDDFRIYNRALTGSEIVALYHEGGPITSINGMKFNDMNGNGVKDPNESGLANWKINISGTVTNHTFTDNNGNYSFTFLPMGSYTIAEENRFGWGQTFPDTTAYFITFDHVDSVTGIDFGNYHYQGSISGMIFNDLDGNGMLDEGESGLAGWILHIMPGNLYATTDSAGIYTFRNLPPETYTIEQYSKQYWQQTYPPGYGDNIVTLVSDEVVTNIYFGNQLMRNIYDLGISVSAGVARPGFTHYYGIMYQNKGTEDIDATVSFIHPPNTEFIQGSASPPPTSFDLGTRTLQWYIGQTIPGTIGFISAAVTIMPPPVVNVGDVLTACSTIDPVSGDVTPGDNQFCTSQIVTGSYDPNDKLVTPAGDGIDHEVPVGIQFEYTVRFQNTGNDTAFSVVVRDTLDPDLLISTLELGASSHPYKFEVSGEGELKWTFANINLPDSNRNEPKSHGFLSYRIRPRGNGVGAIIENKASIYFDYNLPVQTNIVSNVLTSEGIPSWNIISVPSICSDYRKKHLYPTATTNAFWYNNSYIESEILQNGIGYWLKLPPSTILPLPGLSVLTDTIEVIEGWNLIGSISEAIDVSMIPSVPGGIMTSEFFGYSGSYFDTDTIYPGRGYWVKVDQPGLLILSSSILLSSSDRIRIIPTDELPPPPPSDEQVKNNTNLPDQFTLFENYPNPFNPSTVIKYQLPSDSRVALKVFNTLGQVVAVLTDGIESAGNKLVEWNAANVASGMYFYRLEATSISEPSKSFRQVKKMILLR